MNAKLSLALIALVGIGVFALPSTMALFAGQHSFYNIDATGNQIPCQKCHGDVKAELTTQGYSSVTGTKGPHADFQCEYCHRAENGFASGDDAYSKITYTNATGGRIYLVTTVQNFEQGNFPKAIVYQANMTVDNWYGNTYNLDGTLFVNQTQFGNNQDNFNYSGSLSTNGVGGSNYSYSYASEVATESGGAPKDTNPATQTTAFNPRAVTWSGSAESLVGAGSREVTPGTKYHAASLVSCLECHGGDQTKGVPGYQISTPEPYNHANWLIDASNPNSNCSNCHYSTAAHTPTFEASLEAGGFGITSAPNDTGSVEAHRAFVQTPAFGGQKDTVDRYGYGASNGACIACHTHVAVDINFQKGYKLSFSAVEGQQGNYSVGNFAVEGQVNIAVYGNGSGGAFGVGNKTYSWTPGKALYVNGNGSQIVGLGVGGGTSTNDSAAALTTGQ